jgi:hypothetical protein
MGNVTPYFYSGISLGVFLFGKAETDGLSFDIDDGVSTVDLLIPVGAGLQINAGPGKFVMDARFSLGLLDTDDSDSDPVKNMQLFSFMVGYAFQF